MSRACISDAGVTPYIFPAKNVTLKPFGCHAWTDMLWDCVTKTQQWLRGYHPRSNSESKMHEHKCRMPRTLRRKGFRGRYTEALARAVVSNFICLVRAYWREDGLWIFPCRA